MSEEALLFDVMERSDSRPASRSERSFHFLNRVDTPYWSRVRDLLDLWFADYVSCASTKKAADLRARFRSSDPRQHEPAWWELYLFRLIRTQYPEATVAIESPDDDEATSPDFSVLNQQGNPVLHMEAVAPFSGIATSEDLDASEALFLDTINSIESREFGVMVGSLDPGPELPKKTEVLRPIEEWLARLDHSQVVAAAQSRNERVPTFELRVVDGDVSESLAENAERTIAERPHRCGAHRGSQAVLPEQSYALHEDEDDEDAEPDERQRTRGEKCCNAG